MQQQQQQDGSPGGWFTGSINNDERKSLLAGDYSYYGNDSAGSRTDLAKAGRSASISALGGSSSLGTFEILQQQSGGAGAGTAGGMTKSHSISGYGQASYLTPTEMGRSELYQQVPFTAVFGLQKKERSVSMAFASYAAELDVMDQKHLSETEKVNRKSQASMIIMDELEFDTNLVTTPLVFAIIVASLSQFLVGYNTGVMNAPEQIVFPGHSTMLWSLAVAAFAVGGPFGAIVGGQMADKRGRRGALLLDTWTFLLGGLLQTFALDMFTIILARFIIGFASGYSSVLVPIYLGELAPPTLRGMLGTLTQFAMVMGILIADLLAFPFVEQHNQWKALFSITAITALIQLLCASFLLESPRWLLGRDPKSLRARYIIKKLRGLRHDHEVETEVGHFLMGGVAQQSNETNMSGVLKEMFADSKIRFMLLSCLVLQMAQQLSGINAVFYYSTMFFQGVIDNPLVGTTIVGAVNVIATYVALLLMDSTGRKTLLLWSSGGMFLSCIVLTIAMLGYFNNVFALLAVNSYVTFFEIGLGPIPWLIVAEMFEAKYVAVAMSVCSQLNWFCNFIIGLVFPYINNTLGSYSFVPFAIVLLLTFVFTLTSLPETASGGSSAVDTLEDDLVSEMTRKNSSSFVYHANTENTGAIDNEWRKAMEQLRQEEEIAMEAGTYGTSVRKKYTRQKYVTSVWRTHDGD